MRIRGDRHPPHGQGDADHRAVGVDSGCYELFAHEPLRTLAELRGRRLAIQGLNSDRHQYLAIIISPDGKPMELFVEGKGACCRMLR